MGRLKHGVPNSLLSRDSREPRKLPQPPLTRGLGNSTLLVNTMAEGNSAGQLLYLQRLDLYRIEKPFSVTFDTSAFAGAKQHNLALAPLPTTLIDIKSTTKCFSLDVNGFEVKKFASTLSVEDFQDSDIVKARYYPEVEALMRKTFGSALDRVVFISHQVRVYHTEYTY